MSRQGNNLLRLGMTSAVAALLVFATTTPSHAQTNNPNPQPTTTHGATALTVEPLPSVEPTPTQPFTGVWSLDQLAQLAMQYNPSIAKARADIQSARGNTVQAGLYPNPTFDSNTPEQIAGRATVLNIGFFQEVVVKGKKRLDQAAAREAAVQTELEYVNTWFEMLTDIRSQFYHVLAAERRLVLQRELVEIASASQRAAEGRVRALEGTETDLLLLTVELQNIEIEASNYQIDLEGAKRKLAALVGIPELPIVAVQGDLFGRLPDFNEAALQQFIQTGNAEVQSARVDVNRNRVLLRRAEVEPYPNIRAGPCYYWGLDPARIHELFGIQAVFEIPTWDRNQGNIQAQQGEVNAATANVGVVQNDLLGDAANTLAQYRAARQVAESIAIEILPNARRSLELTRSGYDRGLLDISTLLQAQRSLIETSMDLIDAQEEVWTASAELSGVLQRPQFP